MHTVQKSWILLGLTAVAVVATVLVYRRKKKPRPPKLWKESAVVSELFVYPLRSGRRLEVNSAMCTCKGLVQFEYQLLDRSFLIYSPKSKELKAATTFPKMVMISVSTYSKLQVQLNAPGMPTLHLAIPKETACMAGGIRFVCNRLIYTLDCGDEAAEWVSRYILDKNYGLRLGFLDKNASRSDVLVINQASIDDLNDKLSGVKVGVENFRPNIVVKGIDCPPFAEDAWKWIKIGNVILRNIEPCGRCVRINIDHNTGIRSKDMQPLKTLKTYRNIHPDGPVMGYQYEVYCPGVVATNDTVYVA